MSFEVGDAVYWSTNPERVSFTMGHVLGPSADHPGLLNFQDADDGSVYTVSASHLRRNLPGAESTPESATVVMRSFEAGDAVKVASCAGLKWAGRTGVYVGPDPKDACKSLVRMNGCVTAVFTVRLLPDGGWTEAKADEADDWEVV